jgi:hypothetical protein
VLTATTFDVPLVVDGVTINVVGTRVLVNNQQNPMENGIYTLTTAAAPGVAWALTRATDFDQAAMPVLAGVSTLVQSGALNAGEIVFLDETVSDVNPLTDNVTWSQSDSKQTYITFEVTPYIRDGDYDNHLTETHIPT